MSDNQNGLKFLLMVIIFGVMGCATGYPLVTAQRQVGRYKVVEAPLCQLFFVDKKQFFSISLAGGNPFPQVRCANGVYAVPVRERFGIIVISGGRLVTTRFDEREQQVVIRAPAIACVDVAFFQKNGK